MKREIEQSSHVSRLTLGVARGRIHLAALLLYTLLTLLMTWPLALHLTRAIPGDSFDGWQNFWNLWWVKLALVDRQTTPFVTDLLYAPTGVNLYFHTLNPFNGLATLPVQLAGGLYLAYNSVVFLAWALGGYGVFLLTLWVGGRGEGTGDRGLGIRKCGHSPVPSPQSPLPPFIAGLIFTFAPLHMAHLLGHMQVMSLEWMPFYILYLLRATQRQRAGLPWLRDSLLAGLFLVFVGLCDWYFVLYLFLFTAFYLLWEAARLFLSSRSETNSRHFLRTTRYALRIGLPAAVAGLLFLLLLSPILVPMLSEALRFDFMERPASDLYILSAAAADFFVPNRLHTLFRPESFGWPGNRIAPVSERTIAVGYTTLFLAGMAGLFARRRSAFWLAAALFFFLLALGPALHLTSITAADIPAGDPGRTWTLYGVLVRAIPFMRISRSVSRFAVMVQLALSVTAGIGLAALLARIASKRSTRHAPRTSRPYPLLVACLCGLFVLAEFWVAPFPVSPSDTPDFYRQLAADPTPGAVLNLPMNYDRPGYLLYQTVHGKPLAVAYISRDDPRTLTERAPVLQHFRHLGPDILDADPAALGPTVLADLGVGWVVADRYKMPGGLERAYTSELAGAIFAGQPPVYADERITAWRVTPPETRLPYLLLGPLGWGALVEAEGRRGRWLGAEPAGLIFRHTPGLDARLTVRYRTLPGASASVRLPGLADVPLAVLSPAPDGGEATLDFAPLLKGVAVSTALNTLDALTFAPSAPDSVFVESLRLDVK